MANIESAIAMLRAYRDSVRGIMALFPDDKLPDPPIAAEIRYSTITFKASVSRQCRRRGRICGWERIYSAPATHRLFIDCQQIETSTKPGLEWWNALNSAHLGLGNSLQALERLMQLAAEGRR